MTTPPSGPCPRPRPSCQAEHARQQALILRLAERVYLAHEVLQHRAEKRNMKRSAKTSYYVTTWDTTKEAFTPQGGVRTGPWSLWGLRKALRMLRAMGYMARKGDPAVSVVAVEKKAESDATPTQAAPARPG